jgi:hypothetical protein
MTESAQKLEIYDSDFFEEDEPIAKIQAILSREPDAVTAPPDEIADELVTVNPSPWLQKVGRTGGRYVGRGPVARHKSTTFEFRLSGAASS